MEGILLTAMSVVLMVFFFGMTIIVHEVGHFLAARLCGLHVVAFSIGFKTVWRKKIKGVEYRIGCLPFGGYVDLPQLDASGDEIKDENGNPLPRATPWKRIVTAFAGPLFNILFAMLLGCVIWIVGLPGESAKSSFFKIASVEEGSPEHQAGLRIGDRIVRLNGRDFNLTWQEFATRLMLNDDNVKQVVLDVERDGRALSISYVPAVNPNVMKSEQVMYPFFKPELPVLLYPESGSPAEKAGIRSGDRVVSVNGTPIPDALEFMDLVMRSDGKPLTFVLNRSGEEIRTEVVPEFVMERNQIGIVFAGDGSLVVEKVSSDSPAETDFKLRQGDRIVAMNGKAYSNPADFTEDVRASGGNPIALEFVRDGKTCVAQGKAVPVRFYDIGAQLYALSHPNPIEQFENVLVLTGRTLRSLGLTIRRQFGADEGYAAIGIKNLSGPAGIGRQLFLSFTKSFMIGLSLVVLISYSLGLFNLLPIPVLDGGHILFAVVEIVARRPIPARLLQPLTYFFVVVLIGFMLLVTFHDVRKMIPVGNSDQIRPSSVPQNSSDAQSASSESLVKETSPAASSSPSLEKESLDHDAP